MQKIKKGDEVFVLTGKNRGSRGSVLQLMADGKRALVDNVNVISKHVKPNPNKGETGGIVKKEAPIHISNLALFNPVTNKPDRVGIKTLEDGKKVRVFKSNGEVVDT